MIHFNNSIDELKYLFYFYMFEKKKNAQQNEFNDEYFQMMKNIP